MGRNIIEKGLVATLATAMLASPLPAEGKDGALTDFLKYSAGVFTQVVAHEAGHYVGSKINGKDIHFESKGQWYISGEPSDNKMRQISLGGFAFPMAVSAAVLSSDVSRDNPYIQGITSGPLLHNLYYIIRNETGMSEDYNDLATLDRIGVSKELLYSTILGVSAWQAYRGWKDKKKDVKHDPTDWKFGVTPMGEDGIAFIFSKKF